MSSRFLLAEAPRPRQIRAHPYAHWFVVGTVCVGAFMGQVDASIVTVALPTLQHAFGATMGSVEWVALAYLIVLVAIVAPIGRLADMVGRKLLYLFGFVAFVIGSALCGLAPSLVILDGARVLQAIGAAMLQANSVALISHAMPRAQLGRGIGVQGAAQAVGLAIGPGIGGALLQFGDWRLIFWINVPIGVVGLILGWFLLPRSRNLHAPQPFDWLGTALFLPAIGALLGALTFAGEVSTRRAASVPWLLIIAAMLGVAFALRERHYAYPVIDFELFGNSAFALGILSGLLSYAVMFGTLFIVPFFLEHHLAIGPGPAGAELTALPLALGLIAPLAGHLSDRLGARWLTASGMLLTALGLAVLAVGRDFSAVRLIALGVIGVGLGAFTPANNAAIMGVVPLQRSGVAGGVLNMTRGLGTSLGVALTGFVYGIVEHHARRAPAEAGFAIAVSFLVTVALVAAVAAGSRGSAHPDL